MVFRSRKRKDTIPFMKHFSKKLFAMLLCVMLCGSLLPVHASHEITERQASLSASGSGDGINGHGNNGLEVYAKYGTDATGDVCSYIVGWNQPATLTVEATGGTAPYSYQWYRLQSGKDYLWDSYKNDWILSNQTAIEGATAPVYCVESFDDDASLFFACTVTDADGEEASVVFITQAYYYVGAATSGMYFQVHNQSTGVLADPMYGLTFAPGTQQVIMRGGSSAPSYYDDQEIAYAEKIEVRRKENSGKWKTVAAIDGDPDTGGRFSYLDMSVAMGSTYVYKYRAYLNGAWTPYSDTLTIVFNPFEDVAPEDPSFPYIAWAYNNNVVKGDGAGHFNPDDPCTRMNFVMILWKMHGRPTVSGKNPFTDVSGSTSIKAVKWAVKKKLVTGTSATTFSPENNLSRINIIMILYKLAGSPKASATSKYEDISGSKTSKAVNWAVSKGIISPVDATHFAPDDNCSRALLVEILCKYNETYKIL